MDATANGGADGRWRRALSLAMFAAACSSPPKDEAPSKNKEPTSSDELMTSSGDGGPPVAVGDVCGDAPEAMVGNHDGSLFNAAADLAAALDAGAVDGLVCHFDGPDVFVRHHVRHAADVTVTAVGEGFVPMVAILDGTCTQALACASALPAAMLDVAAGTDLWFAVGIAADDPLIGAAQGPEDLRFRLTIDEREVIGVGDGCGLLGQGRCESGSACIDDEDGVAHCTVVPSDTCATATPVDLDDGPVVITVDPAIPYSDAHQHSCAGARRRDRVLHVQWSAAGGTLVAETSASDVALALRGPGCAATEALACAAPGAAGTRVSAVREGAGGAFVFVELPEDDPEGETSEVGPFDVVLRLDASG